MQNEAVQNALDISRAFTPEEIEARSSALLGFMRHNVLFDVVAERLPNARLFDRDLLIKSLGSFFRLAIKAGKEFGFEPGPYPVPQSFSPGIIHNGWPLKIHLGKEKVFPTPFYAAICKHHGKQGLGYNPFFWVFTRNERIITNKFSELWIKNAEKENPVLGGIIIEREDLDFGFPPPDIDPANN